MKTFVRETVENVENRVGVIKCNKCGNIIWRKRSKGDLIPIGEFEIKKAWGYLSDWDLEVHKFDICTKCYKNLIKSFKIPIEVVEYFPGALLDVE